ncbi:ABC transporter permease [Microbacterium telephonicum]|uniref:Peptide/nickel transport system permease protein n=1 Tax=Microbacterium telephonicum TaxID=1714841 RepID=A0A498BSC5_9MICO|nr:ABC transporter permease [Microbacterium telephonicum]RLK46452.1 peptide/nickel transport system permease protein [Microbacterium telephonicum]
MTNFTPDNNPVPVDALAAENEQRDRAGRRVRSGWRMLLPTMTPWLALGLFLVAGIIVFAIVGPWLLGDPTTVRNIGMTGPSAEFLLGTTNTGQDVLAQLAVATRGSLVIGFTVGILATALSAFFGIYGAYVGGFADDLFSLLSNVFLVIPGLPLVIVIAGFVPRESRGLWTIAVVLALTSWAAGARVLRAQTLSVRNRDYVAASKISGEASWRVIIVEILPNLLPVLASGFVFAVIAAILGEAGLAFIGLGASNSSTLGTMLYFAQNAFALSVGAWWWFLPPGLIIALLGMGLSLINFSIDEIINPKLKHLRQHRKRARKAAKLEREMAREQHRAQDHESAIEVAAR